MCRSSSSCGFTLVELAIVLVIIGLLVGGILVGQDLIQGAGLKATISQLDGFNRGAATFRLRVHGIPGDLRSTKASVVGLVARNGGTGRGDGNGIIENGTTAGALQGLGHETALFWNDLSQFSMIPHKLTQGSDAPAASLPIAQVGTYLPSSRIRESAFFHIYSVNGKNFYYLGGFASTATDAAGILSLANALSPIDAENIDLKLDDDTGAYGLVKAVNSIVTNSILTGAGATTDCLNADGSYNTDGADGAAITCRLSIRTDF